MGEGPKIILTMIDRLRRTRVRGPPSPAMELGLARSESISWAAATPCIDGDQKAPPRGGWGPGDFLGSDTVVALPPPSFELSVASVRSRGCQRLSSLWGLGWDC